MRKYIATAVAVFGLFLTGCSQVTSGEVYDKEYEPARRWTTTEPVYTQQCTPRYVNGQYQGQNCQQVLTGWREVDHYDPECYRLDFKNEDGDKGDACVDQKTYDTIEVGDWYDKEDGGF